MPMPNLASKGWMMGRPPEPVEHVHIFRSGVRAILLSNIWILTIQVVSRQLQIVFV